MPLHGDLRTMPLPELLMWISQFRKTGTVRVVENDDDTHILAFLEGALVYSSSPDPEKRLGALLVSRGVVTREMYERARKLRDEEGVGIAKALSKLKLVAPDDMTRFLRKKAEREVFGLFDVRDAEFSFNDREMPTLELLPLRVDLSAMLLRITQNMDENGEYDFDASGINLDLPEL